MDFVGDFWWNVFDTKNYKAWVITASNVHNCVSKQNRGNCWVHAFWSYKKRSIRNTRQDFWKNKKQWLVKIELLRNVFLSQTSWGKSVRNMRSVTSDNQNFVSCKMVIFGTFLSLLSTDHRFLVLK